jgi:hypothetical protein
MSLLLYLPFDNGINEVMRPFSSLDAGQLLRHILYKYIGPFFSQCLISDVCTQFEYEQKERSRTLAEFSEYRIYFTSPFFKSF